MKLKELTKAVKEAGGNLDTQMKAQETLKNYFKKSAQVKKHLNNSSYPWKDEISSGPVINDSLVIYVDSKRLKDIIELESLKIINNIEKKLGFSVNSIRVELQNSQQ